MYIYIEHGGVHIYILFIIQRLCQQVPLSLVLHPPKHASPSFNPEIDIHCGAN